MTTLPERSQRAGFYNYNFVEIHCTLIVLQGVTNETTMILTLKLVVQLMEHAKKEPVREMPFAMCLSLQIKGRMKIMYLS